MTPLERYLHRATRGLWGRKRREVKCELRGSIEARAWQLECQGWSAERALETALCELGEPGAIAAGLTGVHTMPKVLKNTVLLALVASLTITTLNSSRAQIEVIGGSSFTIETPNTQINVTSNRELYFLKLPTIKKTLEDAGIVVDATPQKSLDRRLGVKPVPTLRVRFPGSDRDALIQSTPIMGDSIAINSVAAGTARADAISGDEYIAFDEFFHQLRTRSSLPVRILGWRNPVIEVGATRLPIGTEANPATPRELYINAAQHAVQAGFPQINDWIPRETSYRHAIRVSDSPGTVYAVVTASSTSPRFQSIDAARVADDGVLYINASFKTLEFVRTSLEVIKDRNNSVYEVYGSPNHPAKALLVKITPDLQTSFVLPKRTRSGALNTR